VKQLNIGDVIYYSHRWGPIAKTIISRVTSKRAFAPRPWGIANELCFDREYRDTAVNERGDGGVYWHIGEAAQLAYEKSMKEVSRKELIRVLKDKLDKLCFEDLTLLEGDFARFSKEPSQ
jgi:hypothetical protein